MKNYTRQQNYYEQPNPYVNAPSCNVNLLELSRYAKQQGKRLDEVTQDEMKQFRVISLVMALQQAEERAEKEGWIDADDLERKLSV